MTRSIEDEALAMSYHRLRAAAEAIVKAADYPADGGEPRVYSYMLDDLRRELSHVPQPNNRLSWMSPS